MVNYSKGMDLYVIKIQNMCTSKGKKLQLKWKSTNLMQKTLNYKKYKYKV